MAKAKKQTVAQVLVITQNDLSRVHSIKESIKALEAQLAADMENFDALLKSGAQVQGGGFFTLAYVAGQRRPKWKEEFVARLGEEAAAEVTASTPEGPPSLRLGKVAAGA